MISARILVVTSDASLAQQVSAAGYSVVGNATTSSDAFEQAAEHTPDLALVDLDVPGMNDSLRSLGCPVLCVVNDTSPMVASAVGYLHKPWSASALRWAMASALQRCAGLARERSLEAELKTVIYAIDHDLRAPLRGIDGLAQALSEDFGAQLPAGAVTHVERLRATARRMTRLIDGLLRMARVNTASFRSMRVDVSQLARLALLERQSLSNRNVEVVIEPGIVVEGDESLLHTLIECIIDNAWKFTGLVAAARIEIGAHASGGERVIFVRDNGAGFNSKYKEKLFAPLQRLHSVDEFEGVGLGLATVKRIIDRHGGRIWADGAPGAGATVSFVIGSTR